MKEFLITDENKFSPQFQTPETQIFIREDEPVNHTIIKLTADDEDEGINGKIEYKIINGNEENQFGIDLETGNIFVLKELDYEDIPVYNIIVQAKDMAYYPKSSTGSVKIVLQDVNDNVPKFKSERIFGEIKENADLGTEVIQLKAEDPDSEKNAVIKYEFVETQNNFRIDPNTGLVSSLRDFDYERISSFVLTVKAYNPGSDLFNVAQLIISVIDENEFVPNFLQPIFQFAISESSFVGSVVGKVEAEDHDTGREGKLNKAFLQDVL